MKINKWIIFIGLKIVEIIAIMIIIYLIFLEGQFFNTLSGGHLAMFDDNSLANKIQITCIIMILNVFAIIIISCIFLETKRWIKWNIEKAEEIQERLRK